MHNMLPTRRITRAATAAAASTAVIEQGTASKSNKSPIPSAEKSKLPISKSSSVTPQGTALVHKVSVRQSSRKTASKTEKPPQSLVFTTESVIEKTQASALPIDKLYQSNNIFEPMSRQVPNLERQKQNGQISKTPVAQANIKKVVNSWTPVLQKRKKAATAALKDTFPGRLDWKFQQFGMPVTSTPKAVQHNSITKTDVETCFGFEESQSDDEENYSALLSPIASTHKSSEVAVLQKHQPNKREIPVLQPNRSNEQPKSKINPSDPLINVDSDCIQESKHNKLNNATKIRTKCKERKPVTRQPKRKNPTVSSTVEQNVKKRKTALKMKSHKMFEFDELMSSQQSDLSASGTISEPEEELFIKKIQGNGDNVGFNALLARYGKSENEELEFHVDPGKIKRTYISRKKENAGLIPFLPVKIKKRVKRTKVVRDTAIVADSEDEDSEMEDLETKKWLELKNKEFEDVLHVPLVLANVQQGDKQK